MSNPIRIAPSILAADFTRLGEQVREAEAAGADLIHIDVMDGRFVPPISMGALVVEAVRRVTALPLDVHLMVIEPEHLLPAFAQAGATIITVHWEACPNLHNELKTIHSLGCRAGVALNPQTPASVLDKFMALVDTVIVMTVNPGYGGQEFIPQTLDKFRQLRQMIEATGRAVALEADGGVNRETAAQCVEAGADVLIAGTAVFSKGHTVQQGMERLRQSVGK